MTAWWSRLSLGEKTATVLTIVTLAVGVIAIIVPVVRDEPPSHVASPTSSPPAPSASSVPTSASASSSPSPTPAPPTQSPTPPEPTVRSQGLLSFRPDRGVRDDLDSPRASWLPADGDGAVDGPSSSGSQLAKVERISLAFIGDEPPSYSKCRLAATGSDVAVPLGQLTKGSTLCLITTAGRAAALTLTQDASATEIDYSVIVWQPVARS
jgi:hypothetical protein